MPKTTTRLAAVLLAAVAHAQVFSGLTLRLRHEPGVEHRLLLSGQAMLPIGSSVMLRLAAAGAALDNPGLAGYGIDAELRLAQLWQLRLEAGAAHEHWRDWQAGENRVFGLLAASPLPCLELGAGLLFRVPVTSPTRYASPFHWQSEVPEWNFAYRADWTLLRRGSAELGLRLTNQDLLVASNPQQLPVSLHGRYAIDPHWQARAGCGTAVTGLSGPILALSELNLELGVSRAF